MKTLLLLLLFSSTLFISGCKKQYAVVPPAYLVIDSLNIVTNYLLQGSASHNIKNINIAISGVEYGLYEIPCKIPLTTVGSNQTLIIRPYIKESGQGDYKFNYLYMNNYTANINIAAEQIIKLKPVFSYTSYAKFPWIEDFENSAMSIEKTIASKTNMEFEINKAKVLEGNRCGKVALDGTNNYYEGTSKNSFLFPINGNYTYLEMDYSNTCRFAVGLQFSEGSVIKNELALTLTPTANSSNTNTTWNKVYINLTGIILAHKTAVNFKYFVYAQRDTLHTTDEVLFDNLKFITN
ncbi:MAG: hypothetical protein H7331_01425 [Bacteroidia bacterium]|nr:hypothetical protein [Bacteroidia bacterium]